MRRLTQPECTFGSPCKAMQTGSLQKLAAGLSPAFSSVACASSNNSVGSRQQASHSTSALKPVHQQTVRQQLMLLQQQSALRQLGVDVSAKLTLPSAPLGIGSGLDAEASRECDSDELNDFLA